MNMRVLWFCALLHCVLAQADFGTSYLRSSRLCHEWNCINLKLGLPDSLPQREQYTNVLKSLLPAEWHDALKIALDVCYGNRTRRYTNTCPGQALMHCVVDNLIVNCPEDKWQKEDGCAPVSSLAANKYMFSQSRYVNLQKNLQLERRPAWFLQHYFSTKCCQIPDMFNTTTLTECGFESYMRYHLHDAQLDSHSWIDSASGIANHLREDVLHQVPLKENRKDDPLKVVGIGETEENDAINDPLDCCDLREFITLEWRLECGFRLSWNTRDRLVINDNLETVTEQVTTAKTEIKKVTDAKIVPLSCEKETCIFSKLGIVTVTGTVDRLALSRLLDNMTAAEPRWMRAKARADTKCLSRPIAEYESDCEINKVLACTLDVLSENCPDAKKEDPCRHSSGLQSNITCQISSSKYRPRNRRQFCNIPDFVDYKILKECGVDSLTSLEYAPETPTPNRGWLDSRRCKEETPSTTCLMRKMNVINKYNFLDYFKMKERLRQFCQGVWYPLKSAYAASFSSVPLYKEHCGSQQKLLNVLDTMLITCPISKRRRSAHCRKMFTDISTTVPGYHQNISGADLETLLTHFQHVFLPAQIPHLNEALKQRVVDRPRYNFNFGVLSSHDEPIVRVVDVKTTSLPVSETKPLVLLPVYQRKRFNQTWFNDGVWRGVPI